MAFPTFATPNTPFYEARLIIGNMQIPALPNAPLYCPENPDVRPIIGNYNEYHYTRGFVNPTCDISLQIRDKAGEALSSTLWGWLLSRVNDPSNDTFYLPAGGITYWDGRSGFNLNGCKLDMITIAVSKGAAFGMTCRFCGSNFDGANSIPPSPVAVQPLYTAPTFPAYDSNPALSFQHTYYRISSSGVYSPTPPAALTPVVTPWQWSMTYSNNHTPDMGMDGTVYPRAQNAGIPVCRVNFNCQAADVMPTDDVDGDALPEELKETALELKIISGTAKTFTLTIPRAFDEIRRNRNPQIPRVMRPHSYRVLGLSPRVIPITVDPGGFA